MTSGKPSSENRVRTQRPTLTERRAIDARRRVLQEGLLACYEIIDSIRQELTELDARERPDMARDRDPV